MKARMPDWIDSSAPYTSVHTVAPVHERSAGDGLPFLSRRVKRICRVFEGSMSEAQRTHALPMSSVPELDALAPDPNAHLRIPIYGMPTITHSTAVCDGEDFVAPADDPSLEPATALPQSERPEDWTSQMVQPELHPIVTHGSRTVLDKPGRADWLGDEEEVRWRIQTWQNRMGRINCAKEFAFQVTSFAMDLTEEQDVALGMRIMAMFHQGWEALMPLSDLDASSSTDRP